MTRYKRFIEISRGLSLFKDNDKDHLITTRIDKNRRVILAKERERERKRSSKRSIFIHIISLNTSIGYNYNTPDRERAALSRARARVVSSDIYERGTCNRNCSLVVVSRDRLCVYIYIRGAGCGDRERERGERR